MNCNRFVEPLTFPSSAECLMCPVLWFMTTDPTNCHDSQKTSPADFNVPCLLRCQSPLDEPVVLTDEVIFPLTVSLDKLPVSTLKVKVRRNNCLILSDIRLFWHSGKMFMHSLSFESVMLCCVCSCMFRWWSLCGRGRQKKQRCRNSATWASCSNGSPPIPSDMTWTPSRLRVQHTHLYLQEPQSTEFLTFLVTVFNI